MRLITTLALLAVAITSTWGYHDPHYWDNRSTNVHLFEWKWNDIADECERFLAPKGFGGIQISPPNENLIITSHNRPWWERYQPMSYKLVTRSGDEDDFVDMTTRCNAVGVRIYVDAIINHMTGILVENIGTAGSTANFEEWDYPAVPWTRQDFNYPECVIEDSDYQHNAENIRNCQLVGLKDLDQSQERVRGILVDFLNSLIDRGVAGFRIDAAKHMWPHDLEVIFSRLNNLNTEFGFEPNSKPYIYHEVIDNGGEAVSALEYTDIGVIQEFKYGQRLSNCFLGRDNLRWLVNWGEDWELLPSDLAFVFIDNHDNQRGQGSEVYILSYKYPRPYKAAIGFMLAHPYGEPQIISSFAFEDSEIGPPMDANENIIGASINEDGGCDNGWVCEHRWRQIFEMVGFKNAVKDTDVNEWWDNGNNQIAFCRGDSGFVVFNNDNHAIDQDFQTCLPPGEYCDVISGSRSENSCLGKTVTVREGGLAHISLGHEEEDMFMAIHAGPESRVSSSSSASDNMIIFLSLGLGSTGWIYGASAIFISLFHCFIMN